MRLPLEEVGLDEQTADRALTASMGFARAYAAQAESVPNGRLRTEALLAAASSYRRAGATAMMLGLSSAMSDAFGQAGRLYQQVGSPYAFPMYALSGIEREDLQQRARHFLDNEAAIGREWELDSVYIVLFGYQSLTPLLRPRVLSNEENTLGIFELPVGLYWNLASVLSGPPDEVNVRGAIRPFLRTYDENLGLAVARPLEWRILVQRMHPAEPDIIALVYAVVQRFRQMRLSDILEGVSPLARTIVEACVDTIYDGHFLR